MKLIFLSGELGMAGTSVSTVAYYLALIGCVLMVIYDRLEELLAIRKPKQ